MPEAAETHPTVPVRYRWSCQILYGNFTEFMEIQRRKREVAEERGWHPSTFWIATAGSLNDFFIEREYRSLGEMAREIAEREQDAEFMRLMRASYPLVVQGSVRMEVFEAADPTNFT